MKMGNSRFKVRAWDIEKKQFLYPKLWDNSMPSNWEKHYILSQFTGLHDKNGKEIYEGDVITYIDYDSSHEDEYLNKGVVEYYADEMKFTITNRNTVEIESIDFKKEVEVIGNVLENL